MELDLYGGLGDSTGLIFSGYVAKQCIEVRPSGDGNSEVILFSVSRSF